MVSITGPTSVDPDTLATYVLEIQGEREEVEPEWHEEGMKDRREGERVGFAPYALCPNALLGDVVRRLGPKIGSRLGDDLAEVGVRA